MSATKREGQTLVFFLTTLSVGPLAVGLTRLFMRLHWEKIASGLISFGLLFLVVTILTLGLED